MKSLANMMQQAQDLQSKISELQEKMANVEVVGKSAGGMCEVTLSGKGEAQKIKIDPSLVDGDNIQTMEDLIVAAFNDAKSKADAEMKRQMSDLTGGISLPPGMQLPF